MGMGFDNNEIPVGYSLNNGAGWNFGSWFCGSGNPFMDIFNVTMANFRFANFTGGGSMWNGFMGGGMGGFQMSPYGGAEYSFSSSGSSSTSPKTDEEKIAANVEKSTLKMKYTAMKNLLTQYCQTLNGKEKTTLEETMNLYSNPSNKEHYEGLKNYYTDNRDKIQKGLAKQGQYAVGYQTSDDVESDVSGLASTTNADYIYKNPVAILDKALSDKRSISQKGWVALEFSLKEIIKNYDYTNVSDDTKTKIKNAYKLAHDSRHRQDIPLNSRINAVKSMYYWLRIAEAEKLDNQNAALNEDFSDDVFLKTGAMVALAKADLKKEGIIDVKITSGTFNFE